MTCDFYLINKDKREFLILNIKYNMPRNKFALQNALYVFSNLSLMTAKYVVNLQLQYSAALILRSSFTFYEFIISQLYNIILTSNLLDSVDCGCGLGIKRIGIGGGVGTTTGTIPGIGQSSS